MIVRGTGGAGAIVVVGGATVVVGAGGATVVGVVPAAAAVVVVVLTMTRGGEDDGVVRVAGAGVRTADVGVGVNGTTDTLCGVVGNGVAIRAGWLAGGATTAGAGVVRVVTAGWVATALDAGLTDDGGGGADEADPAAEIRSAPSPRVSAAAPATPAMSPTATPVRSSTWDLGVRGRQRSNAAKPPAPAASCETNTVPLTPSRSGTRTPRRLVLVSWSSSRMAVQRSQSLRCSSTLRRSRAESPSRT